MLQPRPLEKKLKYLAPLAHQLRMETNLKWVHLQAERNTTNLKTNGLQQLNYKSNYQIQRNKINSSKILQFVKNVEGEFQAQYKAKQVHQAMDYLKNQRSINYQGTKRQLLGWLYILCIRLWQLAQKMGRLSCGIMILGIWIGV